MTKLLLSKFVLRHNCSIHTKIVTKCFAQEIIKLIIKMHYVNYCYCTICCELCALVFQCKCSVRQKLTLDYYLLQVQDYNLNVICYVDMVHRSQVKGKAKIGGAVCWLIIKWTTFQYKSVYLMNYSMFHQFNFLLHYFNLYCNVACRFPC